MTQTLLPPVETGEGSLSVHPAAPSGQGFAAPLSEPCAIEGSAPPVQPSLTPAQAAEDALLEAAQRKLQAGELLTKEEANAHFAAGLFNPTNQVYFRAGLIACREYMARFVEAQSPEIAASIRANWWPQLGTDLGAPRRINWNELVASGDDFPVVMRDDISPTLEALPIALAFFPPEVQTELEARAAAIAKATGGAA